MWPVLCLCLSSLTKASPRINQISYNFNFNLNNSPINTNKAFGLPVIVNIVTTGLLLFTDKQRSTIVDTSSSSSSSPLSSSTSLPLPSPPLSPPSSSAFISTFFSLLFLSTSSLTIPYTRAVSSLLLSTLQPLLLVPLLLLLESIVNQLKSIGLVILKDTLFIASNCSSKVLPSLTADLYSYYQTITTNNNHNPKEAHLNHPTKLLLVLNTRKEIKIFLLLILST